MEKKRAFGKGDSATLRRVLAEMRWPFARKLDGVFRKAKSRKIEILRLVAGKNKLVRETGLFTSVGRETVCTVETRKGALKSIGTTIAFKIHLHSLFRSNHRAFLGLGFKRREFSAHRNPIDVATASREVRWVLDWAKKEKQDYRYMKSAYGRTLKIPLYHLKLAPGADAFAVERWRSLKGLVFVRLSVPSGVGRALRKLGVLSAKSFEREVGKAYQRSIG